MPLTVNFEAGDSGRYVCRIILRSRGRGVGNQLSCVDDVRVFQLCCVVMPPGNKATIDFVSPVNIPVVQKIPIVSQRITSFVQGVIYSVSQPSPPRFSDTFPTRLGIFRSNFTHILHVSIYSGLQILIQLSPTVTKLCQIKCDHPACISTDGGHFEHIMVVALNMA